MIVAPLVSLWHLPLFFWEPGGLQPSVLVGGLVVTVAATFFYNWLFIRTGGSVLLVILAHDLEGSIQYEIGWIVMGVWCAVAIALLVFDLKTWRSPAPTEATTPLQATPPKGATSRSR